MQGLEQGRASMFAVWTRQLGAIGLVFGLGWGCASPPRSIEYDSGGNVPDTADGLYRVRTTRVGAAFVKPGARLSDYDRVVIDPVTVSYRATSDRLKRIFQESFERELARSQAFAVVSEAGPSALRVSGHIVNLAVDVPPRRGRERDFVLEAGEMTLILDVRDSQTGEPLARVADRRAIRPSSSNLLGGYESNPVNNWGAVREIFADWARILRDGLDDLRALPVPPVPDAPAADEPAPAYPIGSADHHAASSEGIACGIGARARAAGVGERSPFEPPHFDPSPTPTAGCVVR
jgi:hypothetical protein